MPHPYLYRQHGLRFPDEGWVRKKRWTRVHPHQDSIPDKQLSGVRHTCGPLSSPLLMGSLHSRQLHKSKNDLIPGKTDPVTLQEPRIIGAINVVVGKPSQRLESTYKNPEPCDENHRQSLLIYTNSLFGINFQPQYVFLCLGNLSKCFKWVVGIRSFPATHPKGWIYLHSNKILVRCENTQVRCFFPLYSYYPWIT